MIPRRHVRHLISAYIDGDLSWGRARAVAAHLEECPACARELEEWRAVLRLVSQHAAIRCPIDCAEAVMQRLPLSPAFRPPRRARFPGWVLVPALALIVTAGGGWQWAAHHTGHAVRLPAEQVASARGGRPATTAGRPAAGLTREPTQASRGTGAPLTPAVALVSSPAVVPVHAPVRLEEAFGRSDSLILAADFAEDDR